MKGIEKKQEKVMIRAVSHDEEGRKRVEKTEVDSQNIDTIKYVEKKLIDKGVQRMDRHSSDGVRLGKGPPKGGKGGKYTWEGPRDMAEAEAAPAALDEKDPNYVDEEEEKRILRGEEKDVEGLVVGEVEVAKLAGENEGVGRVEVSFVLLSCVLGLFWVKDLESWRRSMTSRGSINLSGWMDSDLSNMEFEVSFLYFLHCLEFGLENLLPKNLERSG
ncbi:uncharacterized protein G2W53_043452 [Senna tora]|uniref:Uncharacterized protein n=1 Tax=Senna tora TaxID=362788 RepID=A0A834SIX3_9FABA|nr:uncharacterized protein G2W53_043452 [Senna tora]